MYSTEEKKEDTKYLFFSEKNVIERDRNNERPQ